MGALGARAVGLTGADAGIGLRGEGGAADDRRRASRSTSAWSASRAAATSRSIADLLGLGYIPVIASVGVAPDGTLLNVNADTFAAHLAASLLARRLLVAGTTPGVLDGAGSTIARADARPTSNSSRRRARRIRGWWRS